MSSGDGQTNASDILINTEEFVDVIVKHLKKIADPGTELLMRIGLKLSSSGQFFC